MIQKYIIIAEETHPSFLSTVNNVELISFDAQVKFERWSLDIVTIQTASKFHVSICNLS